MYNPINYSEITISDSTYIPSMVKNRNNKTYDFWVRALFQRAQSTLILNVPKIWNGDRKDFLYYCLFRYGYISIFKTDALGLVFNPASLYGKDFFYQFTNAIVTNPALPQSLDLKIGEDCAIIKLTPDYIGIWDIITYFAEKLSLIDTDINTSLINSKVAFMLFAKNKACAQAIKKGLDKINQGDPAVVLDDRLLADPKDHNEPWQMLERNNIKNSYLTHDLLEDYQTLLNAFDTEIGIPTMPYQKKERMVVSESESKKIDATSRSVVWFESLKNSIEIANAMFDNLNMSVELRYKLDEEENDDGGVENGNS